MVVLRQGEKRQHYRATDGRQALLHAGRGRKFWVELHEVAAWGFTLLADETLPLEPKTLYHLRTAAGWSEVELIHAQQPDTSGRQRYGLQRIRDLRDERAEQRTLGFGEGQRLKHDLPKERIANVGYFIALGFAYAVYLYYTWN